MSSIIVLLALSLTGSCISSLRLDASTNNDPTDIVGRQDEQSAQYEQSESQHEEYGRFKQLLNSLAANGHNLSLTEIMAASGTDKVYRHGYHRYYEDLFAPYRDQVGLRFLEIGADSGKSLQAWVEYFSNAQSIGGVAYGVDPKQAKDRACKLSPKLCEKVDIYSVDQSNVTQLQSLISEGGAAGWDIIVDDGSHHPMHMLTSFKHLFPSVRAGGLYIIEDVETSYTAQPKNLYGYTIESGIGAQPPKSAVEKFKQLVDVVSRKHFGHPELTVFGSDVDANVAEVRFGDGLVIVRKKPRNSAEWDKYPRGRLFVQGKDAEPAVSNFKNSLAQEDAIP